MLDKIKVALREGGMRVCFQPMKAVYALDKPATFFEALVRLDALGKLIPAGRFMTAVQGDRETAIALDDFVLRSVAAQVKRHEDYRYAVNVTAASLALPGFEGKIDQLFGDAAKERLVIEVMEDHPLSVAAIATTHSLLKITSVYLDDVGMSFSNAQAIVSHGINGLKIDGSYVVKMLDSRPHRAIVAAVFSICMALDMVCVCEKVENPLLVEAIKTLAGHYRFLDLYLQGYAIGRPELHR